MSNKLIYLDNAATGYPKPDVVKKAVLRAFDKYGGNPGRSGHVLSVEASKAVYRCRETVCDLLNFKFPERVVFTANATHALNMAIYGLAEKGSHIIISNLEHNSVYRPVHALCGKAENEMSYSVFDAAAPSDETVVKNFVSAIKKNTGLAVITAASNICGKILPLKEISRICKSKKIKLIVDASQALGHIVFDFDEICPDVLCSAGHKGLYGPTGTGIAVFAQDVIPKPYMYGGNGLVSELPGMGNELPEMLEAGTLNTVGICGLDEGIKYVVGSGIDNIESKCLEIDNFISENLADMGAVIYSSFEKKIPIVLFNIAKVPSGRLTEFLDDRNICTRGGIHCSPLAHKALFTGEYGAVRVSPGYTCTMQDARRFISSVNEFCKNMDSM